MEAKAVRTIWSDLASCAPHQIALAIVLAAVWAFGCWTRTTAPRIGVLPFLACWAGSVIFIFGLEFKYWSSFTWPLAIVLMGGAIGVWTYADPDATPPPAPTREG